MTLSDHPKLKRSLLVLLAAIFLFGTLALFHSFRRTVRVTVQITIAHLYAAPSAPFPSVDDRQLTVLQRRIVRLSRQEYARYPISYDATVLKYTEGSKEPWCADYVSWIFRQAGQPFSNSNSDSWRIPGVYTLQEYFKAQHHYQTAGRYVPQTGDVAIYNRGQGHTAIVISVNGDTMTTIGGNENGRLRLDTRAYAVGQGGLIGFGTLAGE